MVMCVVLHYPVNNCSVETFYFWFTADFLCFAFLVCSIYHFLFSSGFPSVLDNGDCAWQESVSNGRSVRQSSHSDSSNEDGLINASPKRKRSKKLSTRKSSSGTRSSSLESSPSSVDTRENVSRLHALLPGLSFPSVNRSVANSSVAGKPLKPSDDILATFLQQLEQ